MVLWNLFDGGPHITAEWLHTANSIEWIPLQEWNIRKKWPFERMEWYGCMDWM
jgi:hypothetical protein